MSAPYAHNPLDVTDVATSNSSPYIITRSSVFKVGSYEAWQAFDHAVGYNMWATQNTQAIPEWIKIDLGSGVSKSISSYTITGDPEGVFNPKTWTLQGSEDDIAWDILDSQTNYNLGDRKMHTFTLPAPSDKYRYFILYITVKTIFSNYLAVSELELIGAPEPPSATKTIGIKIGDLFVNKISVLESDGWKNGRIN
jgi:hypothetical protein